MVLKILIGCPVYERYRYCIDKYLSNVKNIGKEGVGETDILLVDNSEKEDFFHEYKKKVPMERVEHTDYARDRIVRARNVLREKVLEENYDYLLSLEIDLFPEKDILKRLLSHKKDIVSAFYTSTQNVTGRHKATGEKKIFRMQLPIAYMQKGLKIRQVLPKDLLNKGLVRVGGIGLGCVLISRDVLEKIKFRYDPEKKACDDMYFSKDAKEKSYPLWVDGNLQVRHEHRDWKGLKR